MIVNDIAIAIYEKEIETISNFVSLSKAKSSLIRPTLQNVVFETQKPSPALRSLYEDETMLGKHFRIEF